MTSLDRIRVIFVGAMRDLGCVHGFFCGRVRRFEEKGGCKGWWGAIGYLEALISVNENCGVEKRKLWRRGFRFLVYAYVHKSWNIEKLTLLIKGNFNNKFYFLDTRNIYFRLVLSVLKRKLRKIYLYISFIAFTFLVL